MAETAPTSQISAINMLGIIISAVSAHMIIDQILSYRRTAVGYARL
jgi:hypothetical protein